MTGPDVYASVAERLIVARSYVCQVMLGEKTSKRVEQAVVEELKRRQENKRDAARRVRIAPMMMGLYTRVAKSCGVSVSVVSRVAKGQATSERVLEALVCEIDRIEREAAR